MSQVWSVLASDHTVLAATWHVYPQLEWTTASKHDCALVITFPIALRDEKAALAWVTG